MTLKRLTTIAAWALLFVALCSVEAAPAYAADDVSIRGANFLRDGKPWVMKGVVVTGLVAAAATVEHVRPAYKAARDIWGDSEIAAIKAYGADTINLKVSQPALDPAGGHYDPAYLKIVSDAVALARKAGLNVIVSMEWEGPTGVDDQLDMPTDATVVAPHSSTARAWGVLAPVFASDRGVMYQLFDEPCAKRDDSDTWSAWQRGHQAAIDAIRHAGAKNVLLAEGIRCGKWLTDVPRLTDPENALAYAVHPYPMPQGARRSDVDMFADADFDRNFGRWQASGQAVVASEWGLWPGNCHDGADGNPTTPQIAANTLNYLKSHQIGLVVWAMDLPGTVWVTRNFRSPTSLAQFAGCKPSGSGIGAMAHAYFTTGAVGVQ